MVFSYNGFIRILKYLFLQLIQEKYSVGRKDGVFENVLIIKHS